MSAHELAARLGAGRVIAPPGALPQGAERLDAAGPAGPHECAIDVERLCLDSTSFRNLREESDGDPRGIARRIEAIVERLCKMHNPATGSGGVLVGTVAAVGARVPDPPALGGRIATLASLTVTPLRLASVGPVDPASPQVPATGVAYLASAAPWAPIPDDLSLETVLGAYDVYGAASHTRALAPPGGTVCVLGAGHAGRLALAAARDAIGPDGTTVAVDVDAAALEDVAAAGLCDVAVTANLRDPLAALAAVSGTGVPPADLTVVVVNARGCESAAILLTADGGTILFFSMATSFTAAALGAEGVGKDVRMIVGSGYAKDRGAYALDLIRRDGALRRVLEHGGRR